MTTVRLIAMFLLVASLSGCGTRTTERGPIPEEIESLERQMWDDYGDGRYSALRERMLDDAVFLSPAGILDRAEALGGMELEACRLDSYSLENVSVRVLGPTVAVITYRSRDDGTCGSGSDVHSSTWVHRDGRWMTAVHHENPVAP